MNATPWPWSRLTLTLGLLPCTAVLLTATFAPGEGNEPTLHAIIELRDGSRIIGQPEQPRLNLVSALGAFEVHLEHVRELDRTEPGGKTKLEFHNGDRVRGTLSAEFFPVATCLGSLQIPFAEVEKMRFSVKGGDTLPPGEGPLQFGGISWNPQRVEAEVRDERLTTLPKARQGFHYGHSGNGRSATLVSNVGNPEWKNYRMEFDAVVAGVDPKFNPHGVRSDQIGFSTYFHIADIKESWNAKGHSAYALSINPQGKWSLTCVYNQYSPGDRGYRSSTRDGIRTLAEGQAKGWELNKPRRIAIEVVGERIVVWLDGKELADVRDEEMDKEIGGITLDHGGVGFRWGWEGMGWIENFSVEKR